MTYIDAPKSHLEPQKYNGEINVRISVSNGKIRSVCINDSNRTVVLDIKDCEDKPDLFVEDVAELIDEFAEDCRYPLKQTGFPFIDKCRDAEKLYSNLDAKSLLTVESILKYYNKGRIALIEPRTADGEPDYNSTFKLVTAVSYVETGFEMAVLKWYLDYIETDRLIEILKGA